VKQLQKTLFVLLLLLILSTPAFALAESDYETGDGWVYQDGTLTITENNGLKDFEIYEQDSQTGKWTRDHTVSDVDTLVIGKNVTELSIEMYDWNRLTPSNITIEPGNPYFEINNGWVVNTKTNTLFGASNMVLMKTLKSIDHIPSDIAHIGARAFSYYQELQQIQLPQGVVSIGERAFENCDSLVSIELPESLISIADIAFDDCDQLSSVKLGSNIEQIGYSAFCGCASLKDIDLGDTKLEILQNISFAGCDMLKLLRLPATVTKIEFQALNGCNQLETLVISSDDIVIESSAFGYCDQLRNIVFTKGTPKSFGDTLFGETGKTPDGKSYISDSSERRGEAIPYPTLYYTAAYANEWAPNGETEWNGYQIQQISQEELDAILAEARGEEPQVVSATPPPTAAPLPTSTLQADTTQVTNKTNDAWMIAAIAFAVMVSAGVVVVTIQLKKKPTKR